MIPEFRLCSTLTAPQIRLSSSPYQSKLFLSDHPRCVPVTHSSTQSCSVILTKTRSSIRPSAAFEATKCRLLTQPVLDFRVITIEQSQGKTCLIRHHG